MSLDAAPGPAVVPDEEQLAEVRELVLEWFARNMPDIDFDVIDPSGRTDLLKILDQAEVRAYLARCAFN